ncbi:(Fe-S)-binding protein [Candidatus Electronema sp. JM]|uniref:(Fe-S)-binding protein n=1 Tax=Candidatus Electronema sp. JM TaxID=3401571 RepID=UPI003AA7F1F7
METGNSKETGCAKCGACVPVCPVFAAEGKESLAARGRLHLLAAGCVSHPSDRLAELFACCLLCGACEQVCPRRLPITQLVAEARSHFPLLLGPACLQKTAACAALARPVLLEMLVKAGLRLKHLLMLPKNSGLRLKLALAEERPPVLPLPENLPQADGRLAYFVGCFARHVQPSIAAATERLLRRCGLTALLPAEQCCCGLAAWSSGKLELARELAQRNITAFTGDGPVLASCASCSSHLRSYPRLFAEDDPWHKRARAFAARVQEFCSFFKELLPPASNFNGLRLFYHDPCHLRFEPNGLTAPRILLKQCGFNIIQPENGPACCGQGGLFHIACPETSAKIFSRCSRQALAGQPACITSTCSGCLMQYQLGLAQQNMKIRVAHLAVLLEEAIGGGAACEPPMEQSATHKKYSKVCATFF